jgi:FkbM family methyltransferase
MFIFERCARILRHLPVLERMNFFWDKLTPAYENFLKVIYPYGLKRVINKTDVIYLPHTMRHFVDKYEPHCWGKIMGCVKPGDTIADVGSFLGFYAFAFAKRAGKTGKVVAFEPDCENASMLKEMTKFYKINSKFVIAQSAVGDKKGMLQFNLRHSSESGAACLDSQKTNQAVEVECTTLDEFFADEKLDFIKIDVEGYEGKVIEGAANILKRKTGFPRAIFIEIHSFLWKDYSHEDKTIVSILKDCGYQIQNTDGKIVETIKDCPEIFAFKNNAPL